ncbi:hypothetical protein FQJ88_01780 [Xanthomonas vasicola]|uniref:Integrase n=1 Tax=Xanthomonas vasicola TaxID=56459 RepID=A0ABD7SEP1_XANVA|nr:hypothetical protein NX81_008100 [Xanthomonas vasicola]TWQ27536.1 hypothetical protein FQJ97_07535 [Xanthomonas vasicola]TWQ41827.1 hypothetical protein FQJ96_01365 [Xanthomonas vasicola]TWQ56982.1 hypothetical protein FQK01_01895 [Xanthomonas vasicola]TWQ59268.1 hypothetical protein FQJ94_01945 [Xanthomonas vasicola]
MRRSAGALPTTRTDHLDWSLPTHRRATLGGMDAATELTWTYLQRVLRWWAARALQQTHSVREFVGCFIEGDDTAADRSTDHRSAP